MNVSPNNRPTQAQAQVNAGGRAGAPARPGPVRPAPRANTPVATQVPGSAAQKPGDRASMPSRAEVASSLQRLEAYAESLDERLRNAALDAPAEESAAFREVADVLASGIGRIRDGIADGSLAPDDIQRGTKVLFERSRQTLEKARMAGPTEKDGGDAPGASAGVDAARDASGPEAGRDVAANADTATEGADAPTGGGDPQAETQEASRDLGRSILARLENLPAELMSLIDADAVADRSGRLYGPLDGAEAITPRDGRVDLAG